MKTQTKIVITLILMLSTLSTVYANRVEIDYENYTIVHYEYNDKSYDIKVPNNISYLDNKYMHGECRQYCKLIEINHKLIKLGLDPIY